MTNELQDTLTALAIARIDAESSKNDLAYLKKRFEFQYAETIRQVKDDAARVEELDTKARALAQAAYFESQETHPAPGVTVGVGEKTALAYDPKVALAWARDKNMALALDTKAFEKIASVTDLEFVVRTTEPTYRIAIATDLGKFYPVTKTVDEEPTPVFTPGYPQEENA